MTYCVTRGKLSTSLSYPTFVDYCPKQNNN